MKFRAILLAVLLLGLTIFIVQRARFGMLAAVPPNMPPDARFVQTGYDLAQNERVGQWIVCREDASPNADWCRVTSERGDVVFEGQFLPLSAPERLPASQLGIGQLEGRRLWTAGPAEQAPVPVIPLANGQVLVPIADRLALIDRWAKNPEESKHYLVAGN
jgi:hypothetical protein